MVTRDGFKRHTIRATALLWAGVVTVATFAFYLARRLRHPGQVYAALRRRSFLWPWLTYSCKLTIGVLVYNAFVFFLVEPILRALFPPLSTWEHIQGAFTGSSRVTYAQIAPTIATVLWIVGNALVVTILNRRLQAARNVG